MNAKFIVGVFVGAALLMGCDQSSREEAIDRVSQTAKRLNGTPVEKQPDIVVEQQRKERIRQNTQWTVENQVNHPIEYCQAQLEETKKYAKQLEVKAHEVALAQSATRRSKAMVEGQVEKYSKFLELLKGEYRKAESAGQWPIVVNGFSLAKEKTQKMIEETHQQVKEAKEKIASLDVMQKKLNVKFEQIGAEMKSVEKLREKIQTTISDIQLKRLVEGEKGINDALNAINDSLNAFNDDTEGVSAEDIMQGFAQEEQQKVFDAIMAEDEKAK